MTARKQAKPATSRRGGKQKRAATDDQRAPAQDWVGRIAWLVDQYEQGNRAAFGRKVGISGQGARNLYAGNAGPSAQTLALIVLRYPRVNPDWLLTGRGAPERPSHDRSAKEAGFERIAEIVLEITSRSELAGLAHEGARFAVRETEPPLEP